MGLGLTMIKYFIEQVGGEVKLSGFRLFARRIGSGPWIGRSVLLLRTQAGLLALRGRLIMLRQTEEVTRR